MTAIKEQDLRKLEQQATDTFNATRNKTLVICGRVSVVAQNWRCNPTSGRVSEYVRLSYQLNGKRVSRNSLLA